MRWLACLFGFHGTGPLRIALGFLETYYTRSCPHCGQALPYSSVSHEEIDEVIFHRENVL